MMYAAQQGHDDVVDTLIENEADVNATNDVRRIAPGSNEIADHLTPLGSH